MTTTATHHHAGDDHDARRVIFSGAKGGVGTSTVAVLHALALARAGHPTTLTAAHEFEDRRRDFSRRLTAVIDAGLGPESAEAAGLVEELRQSLPEEYAAMIVEGYVTRPETFGFVVRPDEQRPGMAEFLRDAFVLTTP